MWYSNTGINISQGSAATNLRRGGLWSYVNDAAVMLYIMYSGGGRTDWSRDTWS